jgi:hypothetical protein
MGREVPSPEKATGGKVDHSSAIAARGEESEQL